MPRIGLVLGAGGITGEAYHRGVLTALYEVYGIDTRQAEVIVGTSAGSLAAATLRAPRGPLAAVADDEDDASLGLLSRLPVLPSWAAVTAAARHPWRTRPGVLAASLLPAGTRSTAFLSAGARRRFGADWPDREMWVVAVRRSDGRRVVFGRDDAPSADVGQAVAASCAVPGYFRPVRIGGVEYVDGGVHSPTNADLLADRPDLDLVIVSSPMSVRPAGVRRPRLDLSLRLMWHRNLLAEVRRLHQVGLPVITFEPSAGVLSALGLHPMRAERIDVVEELAYESALANLERLDLAA